MAVPEGRWRLLSYTINRTETPKPSKPANKDKTAKKEKEAAKDGQAFRELASQLATLLGGGISVAAGPRYTFVAAQATRDYKAVEVRKGKTVELPFGPPYKPVVTAFPTMMERKGVNVSAVALQMSLVGSAGEVCTNLMVDSGRPPKPSFTITDPKGKVVEQGDFEYG